MLWGCASAGEGDSGSALLRREDPLAEAAFLQAGAEQEDAQQDPPQQDAPLQEEEPEEVWPEKKPKPAAEVPLPADDTPPPEPAGSGPPVHGEVSTRYRYRAVDGESDQDLMASILLDVGDPERDDITAHVTGYASLDVDGAPSGDDPPVFSDITDSYDNRIVGWIYEGYVDLHSAKDLETVRIGRQDSQQTPVLVTFDGLRVESRPLGDEHAQIEVYGGVPAHFFESDSEGDLVFGLAGSARPWDGGRVRLDWMHLEDEALLGSHVNDLIGLELWQRVDERLLLDGRASMLEGEARDMRLRGTYADVEQDLLLEAAWTTLFNPQNDLVQELDPFTATLMALEPYDQAQVQGSKGVGEDLILAAGYDLRRLKHEDDEGQFNREFDRLHATATTLNTFDLDLTCSLTGELWDATGSEVTSWGADVSREWYEAVEGSLGTYYALYKFDFLAEEERENVRTYFAEVEWKQGPGTVFELRYELEHDSFDTYHLVRVGMRWGF